MSVNILGKEYPIATTTELYLHDKSLTELRVDKKPCFLSTPIHDAPESIGRLSNLKTLYLYRNNLTEFLESIRSLYNLQKLDLRNNKLTRIL